MYGFLSGACQFVYVSMVIFHAYGFVRRCTIAVIFYVGITRMLPWGGGRREAFAKLPGKPVL